MTKKEKLLLLKDLCARAVLEQEDTVSFYSNGTTGLPDFSVSKDCMLFLYDIEKQGEKSSIRERYDRIKESEWFKKTHEGMSVSEEEVDNTNVVVPKDYSSIDPHFFKPADKVEPKFKVGDWIINRTDATIMQIVNNEDFYESVEIGGQRRTDTYNYVEWDFRLWTIQDAKDGDILTNGNSIVIFRKIGNKEWTDVIDYYIGWFIGSKIIIQKFLSHWGRVDEVKLEPATKEQCDLLFQKMKEAGYEWDAEKKELKKIE